jgi:hypothetical protein
MNEYSLHSEVKSAYSLPGDQFEVKLGNYVVDILRENLAIEVQTKNFSALKQKLQKLTDNYQVRLVYPLWERKWITHISKDQLTQSRRKSPTRGRLTDVFRELVMITEMIRKENFSLEVLLIDGEEVRFNDGKGSWRRKGLSIKDRKLLKINSRFLFSNRLDYLKLLPAGLNEVFTNADLAKLAKMSVRTAGQMTYCMRKSGALQINSRDRRGLAFQRVQNNS